MDEILQQLFEAGRRALRDEIQQAMQEAFKDAQAKKVAIESPEDSGYMTQQEAAAYLRVSKPTIIEMSKRGIIKTYRLGRSCRYIKTDLDEALMRKARKVRL